MWSCCVNVHIVAPHFNRGRRWSSGCRSQPPPKASCYVRSHAAVSYGRQLAAAITCSHPSSQKAAFDNTENRSCNHGSSKHHCRERSRRITKHLDRLKMAEAYSLSFHTEGSIPKTDMETGYKLQKTIMIVSIPICTLGLLGNGIVLWLLCFRIKKTNFTVYFLNMAVADLMVLFYYIVVFILFLNAVPVSLFYLHIVELTHAFGFNASTYILTAISAERYFMVFYPEWYKLHRPKYLSEIMCALLWSLSCLMSVVLYLACYLQFDPSLTEVNSSCGPTKNIPSDCQPPGFSPYDGPFHIAPFYQNAENRKFSRKN
ncbi:uncharacterized protein LOC121936044 [Sceloporus undulatus]|uniref:uncharacterized protein LOC121936044 n=1 Tax=Sceloporus undulatus TaxID=8520 RepID=UPI001C4D311B|nr:uncharacterized protein LOC121936044 [Sceloporus undulatus]